MAEVQTAAGGFDTNALEAEVEDVLQRLETDINITSQVSPHGMCMWMQFTYIDYTCAENLGIFSNFGGNKTCINGILDPNSAVCCPKSCGQCGGKGCSKRPGGSKMCCAIHITSSCLMHFKPPCHYRCLLSPILCTCARYHAVFDQGVRTRCSWSDFQTQSASWHAAIRSQGWTTVE